MAEHQRDLDMTCKPKCGGFKMLHTNTGGPLHAHVLPVVHRLTVAGSKLQVHDTDGVTYELELPKAEPANVTGINILNASGTKLVATVATLNN